MVEVAYRCPSGHPGVVKTLPRLPNGTPFPTVYYLTCPRAVSAVSTLEALVDADVPAKLMIIGRGSGADELRELALQRGVGDRLILRQDVGSDELPAAVRAADVVISTSEYEGFGLSIVEAMACGVPVVAMAAGGLTDVVDADRTGLLVGPGDVAALTDGLRRLAGDRELRQRFGAAGRERVQEHYTPDAMARSFASAYATSIGSVPGAAWSNR